MSILARVSPIISTKHLQQFHFLITFVSVIPPGMPCLVLVKVHLISYCQEQVLIPKAPNFYPKQVPISFIKTLELLAPLAPLV